MTLAERPRRETLARETFAHETRQREARHETRPGDHVLRRGLVLETERLVLRAPRLADAKTVAALAGDRRIAENTARIPHPYGIEDARAWITSLADDHTGETFLVTTPDDRVVGACGYEARARQEPDLAPTWLPEIGYWIGAPFWGHGYATEAARALVDYVFTHHGLEVLLAGARTSNPASRRVLEKCGFQWTGVALHRIKAISSSAPVDRFRLERSVWASLKQWGRAPTRVRRSG